MPSPFFFEEFMKRDILTLSRVHAILGRNEINLSAFNASDMVDYALFMSVLSNEAILEELCKVIKTDEELLNNEQKLSLISDYFIYFGNEQKLFMEEIEKRKKHVIDLGYYKEDTEEELLKKLEEVKDIYPSNQYLEMYVSLEREQIRSADLTISEAMLISELIACQSITKGAMELLAYIESDRKSFCEAIKKLVKHANFYAFALDIYNDVEKMYEEVNKKDKK